MADLLFRLVKLGLRSLYRKPTFYGIENFDKNAPSIFLCNHERFYGPIMVATRFPIPVRQWATNKMIETEETKIYVKETLFMDSLNMKEGISTILGNMAAYPISWIIRNGNPIAAYSDARRSLISIKLGIDAIKNGEHQQMFAPNCPPADKDFAFMQGYLVLARFAKKVLGISPKLYPMALNKNASTGAVGIPTILDASKSFKAETKRVNDYIISQIRLGYDNPAKMSEG